MVRRLRETKWAALAAVLLLLGQPGLAQKYRPTPDQEAALEEPANDLEAVAAELEAEAAAAPAPAPPRTPRPQPEPRPAIWLLQDADTRIYLFGTVHILPPGFRWRSPAVDNVIRQADELVLEIDDRDAMGNPAAIAGAMLLGKEVPLAWRVSPDRREALGRMMEELGLPAWMTDSMHSWAAAVVIMAVASVRGMGGGEDLPTSLEEMPGVEDGLEVEFRALNRPISGVETVAEQMGFFSNMSFASQRELLEAMIDDYARAEGVRTDSDLLDQWVSGHPEAIDITDETMPVMLYDVLLTRRNRAWTDWLIARLDRPGTVLFAVGAGHLAGPDSVQTMLTARGFTATRLD
jgi:uncharacterized protein